MRPRLLWPALAVALAAAAACKDPETAARQDALRTAERKLAEGRTHLEAGRYDEAIAAARAAITATPKDPAAQLLLADAQQRSGNESAAILALKAAAELSGGDPAVKKSLAELYRRSGNTADAIRTLTELRDLSLLTDPEILTLSRLQAHAGQIEDAFGTLELIQRRAPDDPQAKVLEAEILLLGGDELLAANLMDRLVTEHRLSEAWVLRARYFLNSGRADLAEADLAQVDAKDAERREVVQLKARVLNELKRPQEAEAALRKLLEVRPHDEELIAQLAECVLYQDRPAEAEELVGQALARRPRYPRALYVRARALEAQGDLRRAAETYQHALRSDPGFAPALSRIWRLYQHRGEKGEAMSALERLFFMGEASLDEKVALAELYAGSKLNVTRGRRLIEEALRREPDNARFKRIRAQLIKAGGRTRQERGPVIIRGGR